MRLNPLPLAVAALALGLFGGYLWSAVLDRPAAERATREGDRLLADGAPARALERFEAALRDDPALPAARLGRALALLADGRGEEAERSLSGLILALRGREADPRLRAALAAALANRGILRDRDGRLDEALADYRAALALDPETVAGPGPLERMLTGQPDPATIASRAARLEERLSNLAP